MNTTLIGTDLPIARWVCKVNCGGREVPLDHFSKTDCGDCYEPGKGIHQDFASAVLEAERGHYRFGRKAIGVTDLVSSCPRACAIKHDVKYAVDPLTLNAPLTGTAWHKLVEDAADDPKMSEIEVSGKIEGVEVITAVDRLRMKRGLIEDWKHRNDYASKYDKRDGPKPEHVAQLSLGAELVEQTMKWRPTRGTIWAHYTGGVGLYPMPATLLSLSDVLEFRPWKGGATVRDHLVAMESWRLGQAQWSDLPLFGEEQTIGDKTACDYCAVFTICKEQARGAAF